jgi:hypothetical protein
VAEVRFEGRLCDGALRASTPYVSDPPCRRILVLFSIAETLTDGFRIARQDPRDILNPTMPQLGRFYGRIPPSILLREPTDESLHLPFDIC